MIVFCTDGVWHGYTHNLSTLLTPKRSLLYYPLHTKALHCKIWCNGNMAIWCNACKFKCNVMVIHYIWMYGPEACNRQSFLQSKKQWCAALSFGDQRPPNNTMWFLFLLILLIKNEFRCWLQYLQKTFCATKLCCCSFLFCLFQLYMPMFKPTAG